MDATTPAHNDSTSRTWFTRTATPMWTLLFLVLCSYGCSTSRQGPARRARGSETHHFLEHRAGRGHGNGRHAAQEVPRTGGRHRFEESARGEIRAGNDVVQRGDPEVRGARRHEPGKAYLARITPYAYVAAEMLGAKLNILAIYRSVATGENDLPLVLRGAEGQVRGRRRLEARERRPHARTRRDVSQEPHEKQPAKFLYHDRFSTSSYFLPSLYFKTHDVFAMNHSLNPISSRSRSSVRIDQQHGSRQPSLAEGRGSGRRLGRHEEEVRTRMPGTRSGWQVTQVLAFIPIPTAVPNDFLVASGISEDTERLIVAAIKANPAPAACARVWESLSSSSRAVAQADRMCGTQGQGSTKDDFDAWYVWDSNDTSVRLGARGAGQAAARCPPAADCRSS